MKAEGRAVALYVGIIVLALFLFSHEAIFDILNEVLFIGSNAAVDQGNVTGTLAEVGLTGLYFAIILFLIMGMVFLLVGRGETG